MTTKTYYVREAIHDDGNHLCPCCKQKFEAEQTALDCCQREGMCHIKEYADSIEAICGISAEDWMEIEDDVNKLFENGDIDFDINGYCHFCLREDTNH